MKLEYTFKNDTLFKMVFVKYPELLKRLVAQILRIPIDSIEQFVIINSEMPPATMGDKLCRLDINMVVNGQRVDLEIQITDEGDYTERSLYYWAREFSSVLSAGGEYHDLPRTIVISIVAFKMFACSEFHSEFQVLEVTRHTPLNDKLGLHFFELPKLPEVDGTEDELKLWLALFNAETEEDLAKLEGLGVPVMAQAIGAYRQVVVTDEFKQLERMREDARHHEASALGHARREGKIEGKIEGFREADEKWQGIVTEQVSEIDDLRAQLAELRAQLGKTE